MVIKVISAKQFVEGMEADNRIASHFPWSLNRRYDELHFYLGLIAKYITKFQALSGAPIHLLSSV